MEEDFRRWTAENWHILKDRLHVKRLPNRARFDICRAQAFRNFLYMQRAIKDSDIQPMILGREQAVSEKPRIKRVIPCAAL